MTNQDTLTEQQLAELSELLRIPSVSSDPTRVADIRAAADWIAELVRRGGGEATIMEQSERPLVDALVRASSNAAEAPTVICYGHFDVQSPAPLDLWESDPFSPEIRDGWLYARGVADDKGQLWTLLRAALDLAAEGRLPINVRFCCDAEEEIGGMSIVDFLDQHAGDAAACVIFDAAMLDADTPVFYISARGTLYLHVEARAGQRDLHSGVFGGAALNALHVLVAALNRLLLHDGRLVPALQAGLVPVGADEARGWSDLPDGAGVLAAKGAIPADETAAEEFYLRTWALPSIDINGIEGGSPVLQKTIVVSSAHANVSMRLASGQTVERVLPVIEQLLRQDLPAGAELDVEAIASCDPGPRPPTRAYSSSPRMRSSVRPGGDPASCAAAARFRSCRSSSASASRPSSPASTCPTATFTHRTSECVWRTSRSRSRQRASSFSHSPSSSSP